MISAWTKHLKDPAEQEKFKNTVLHSKAALDRLEELLQEAIEHTELTETSPKIYDLPNWDYRQAHTNGFKSALRMVSKIISLDPKET